jgi:hypothetical protein
MVIRCAAKDSGGAEVGEVGPDHCTKWEHIDRLFQELGLCFPVTRLIGGRIPAEYTIDDRVASVRVASHFTRLTSAFARLMQAFGFLRAGLTIDFALGRGQPCSRFAREDVVNCAIADNGEGV